MRLLAVCIQLLVKTKDDCGITSFNKMQKTKHNNIDVLN